MYKMTTVEDTLKSPYKHNPQNKAPTKPLNTCDSYKHMSTMQVDAYFKNINKHDKFQTEQSINRKALFELNKVKLMSIAVDTTSHGDHVMSSG